MISSASAGFAAYATSGKGRLEFDGANVECVAWEVQIPAGYDDTEERDKPKQLLRPPPKPKAKPKGGPTLKQRGMVAVELTKPQALVLADAAAQAIERWNAGGSALTSDRCQKHRTLQRALAVVREATRPAKETP